MAEDLDVAAGAGVALESELVCAGGFAEAGSVVVMLALEVLLQRLVVLARLQQLPDAQVLVLLAVALVALELGGLHSRNLRRLLRVSMCALQQQLLVAVVDLREHGALKFTVRLLAKVGKLELAAIFKVG